MNRKVGIVLLIGMDLVNALPALAQSNPGRSAFLEWARRSLHPLRTSQRAARRASRRPSVG